MLFCFNNAVVNTAFQVIHIQPYQVVIAEVVKMFFVINQAALHIINFNYKLFGS